MNVQVLGDDVGFDWTTSAEIAEAMRVRNVTAVRKPSFLSRSQERLVAARTLAQQRLVTNPQYRGLPEYRTIPYKSPEPYGFGDDSQGLDGEGWDTFFKILRKAAPIVAPIIINRLTPSQKAELQAVTGTSTSIGNPPPPEKSFMEKYGVYVAIGGALVIGSIVMVKTRRRPSPAAA